jgi:hypothetical protein
MRALLLLALLGSCSNKKQWLDVWESSFESLMCNQTSYFRQCFDVDEPTCRSTMHTTATACAAKEKDRMPDKMDAKSGEFFGREIGRCAGIDYEKQLIGKRKDDARCNDPGQWIHPKE